MEKAGDCSGERREMIKVLKDSLVHIFTFLFELVVSEMLCYSFGSKKMKIYYKIQSNQSIDFIN